MSGQTGTGAGYLAGAELDVLLELEELPEELLEESEELALPPEELLALEESEELAALLEEPALEPEVPLEPEESEDLRLDAES